MYLTQINTSRKLSVACTVRMAAFFFLLLKVRFAFIVTLTFTFKIEKKSNISTIVFMDSQGL